MTLQEFFDFFLKEHNLVLTPGQMEDIIHAARQVPASEVPVIPVHPAVEPEKPGYDWRNYQMPPQ